LPFSIALESRMPVSFLLFEAIFSSLWSVCRAEYYAICCRKIVEVSPVITSLLVWQWWLWHFAYFLTVIVHADLVALRELWFVISLEWHHSTFCSVFQVIIIVIIATTGSNVRSHHKGAESWSCCRFIGEMICLPNRISYKQKYCCFWWDRCDYWQ